MKAKLNWIERWRNRDRRKGDRRPAPPLIAHYWPGALTSSESIRDISDSGFFLKTEHRWYPGTVFRITLQRTDNSTGVEGDFITVSAMVVRVDALGAGFAFVEPREDDAGRGSYRDSIRRFVEGLKTTDATAHFHLN